MTRIKLLVDKIDDEICGAKEYAEEYVYYKAKGNSTWANKYKEMAQSELGHAMILHEKAVADIDELKKVYTVPVEMQNAWDESHKKYVEKTAWIKQMLTL